MGNRSGTNEFLRAEKTQLALRLNPPHLDLLDSIQAGFDLPYVSSAFPSLPLPSPNGCFRTKMRLSGTSDNVASPSPYSFLIPSSPQPHPRSPSALVLHEGTFFLSLKSPNNRNSSIAVRRREPIGVNVRSPPYTSGWVNRRIQDTGAMWVVGKRASEGLFGDRVSGGRGLCASFVLCQLSVIPSECLSSKCT